MMGLMQLSAPCLTFNLAASRCPARQPTASCGLVLLQFIAANTAVAVAVVLTGKSPSRTGSRAAICWVWFFQYPGVSAGLRGVALVLVIVQDGVAPAVGAVE